jgi:hypothetical protein
MAVMNLSTLGQYDYVNVQISPTSANTVQLQLPQVPYTLQWYTFNAISGNLAPPSLQLDQPQSTALANQSVTAPVIWGNMMDGFNGWEEYIIVDAARKIVRKEEGDTADLERDKAGLLIRIESEAANRDIGQPQSAADTSGSWFDSPTSGSGGAFGGDY